MRLRPHKVETYGKPYSMWLKAAVTLRHR